MSKDTSCSVLKMLIVGEFPLESKCIFASTSFCNSHPKLLTCCRESGGSHALVAKIAVILPRPRVVPQPTVPANIDEDEESAEEVLHTSCDSKRGWLISCVIIYCLFIYGFANACVTFPYVCLESFSNTSTSGEEKESEVEKEEVAAESESDNGGPKAEKKVTNDESEDPPQVSATSPSTIISPDELIEHQC